MKHLYLPLLLAFSVSWGACQKKETEKKQDKSADEIAQKDDKKQEQDDKGKDKETKKKGLEGWEVVPQKSVGAITANMKYADLEEAFGKENLKKDEFCIEGDCRPATKVLENDKEMVSVVWENETKRKIEFIQVLSARIKLPNDIHLGTTLKTLVKKNGGKAIKFSGFDWDMSGNIQDYNKGNLDKTVGDYSIGLAQDKEGFDAKKAKLTEAQMNMVMGDVTLTSTMPIFEKLPVKVDRIHVFFRTEKDNKKRK
ncbi:MAG: hypothetical protein EAZ95_01395 [Bacteroidetes bacterium]|nr:MAG: hypothetical protein EAZ95_01395 [Bacteroidota bacterium]